MRPSIAHSEEFINQWLGLLGELYGYARCGEAVLVPGLTGSSSAVYLPLLNYSNLSLPAAKQWSMQQGARAFQVRVLDFECQQFTAGDTVTLRMDIVGKTVDEVFNKTISSKCRNQIRKSETTGLILKMGIESHVIEDFYRIFSATMHRHGTPVFSKKLFTLLPKYVETQFLVAYLGETPVAALCLLVDGPLAWVPWAGSLMEHKALLPNQFLYWRAIQAAINKGSIVFDFGRSGYLAPTYAFKQQWGAKPVKIVVLSSSQNDVYQKYSFASNVWKRLPKPLVDLAGPVLCKYLADL